MPRIQISGMSLPDGDRFENVWCEIDTIPNECPLCHTAIVPVKVGQGFQVDVRLELFFRCVNWKCLRSFVGIYQLDRARSIPGASYFELRTLVPNRPVSKQVVDAISEISPDYVRIWGQAQQAEAQGLDDIAGPGYRKALEFLVKDYAISLQEDNEAKEEIKKIQLGGVIAKYLSGDKLPVVSARAAWLGNDQTHYEKRWVGKDLQDLKRLINATEHFIAMEILAATLPTEMPHSKDR